MPGLPLTFLPRFNADRRFGRDTTFFIKSALPKCPLTFVAVAASTLPPRAGASPQPSKGSSSCLDFCGMATSETKARFTFLHVRPFTSVASAATTASADSSLHLTRGVGPFRLILHRLASDSCASARSFDPRFFPTVGRPPAVALLFVHNGLLTRGLAPPS